MQAFENDSTAPLFQTGFDLRCHLILLIGAEAGDAAVLLL